MSIEFQKPNSDRPRIVVYEQRPNSKFRLRVLYLQLVMMAEGDFSFNSIFLSCLFF